MTWLALNCPQCSAPLPRVAIWRSVKCASCGALITRGESIVERDSFRQALARAKQGLGSAGGEIQCRGQQYHLMQHIGSGTVSEVWLARRLGTLPFLATLKLSSTAEGAKQHACEAEVLRELQTSHSDAAASFAAQRLPEVIAEGKVDGSDSKHALVLRHPTGYWGSLAALSHRFPSGIDPRHAVWIWRRMLDVLHFIHAQGWSHGDIRPEHALVHPQDHGVKLIGWASAEKNAGTKEHTRDLMHCSRVVMVLLCGATDAGSIPSHVPSGLAKLVSRASDDEDFCRTNGAPGIDTLLRAEAAAAFGPPTFVPLNL